MYGDIIVTFLPSVGESQVVGRINGLAVYTPNAKRWVNMKLYFPSDVELANGQLRVTFLEPSQSGGALLAEAIMVVE